MAAPPPSRPDAPRPKLSLGRVVIDDLRRANLRRTLKRDLRELYCFYVDEDLRARLAAMSRVKRWVVVSWWLLKSMILKLSPARRLLLLAALLCLLSGGRAPLAALEPGLFRISLNLHIVAFAILFFILMLELKDKLLTRDEMTLGREVQLALLPRQPPELPGWGIWIYTRPANDVGGDLVDYLALGERRLGVVLGDVAGKGLGAALLMAKLQATLRALAPDFDALDELGTHLNDILHRDGLPNRFATLAYLELEANSPRVRVLNAGHLPPVVVHAAGLTSLTPAAPPLGLLPKSRYAEQQMDLRAGEMLVVYSDGLSEARNEQQEFFGESRLRSALGQLWGLTPEAAGQRLLAEVEGFVGDERFDDDLSLVVLQRSAA